MSLQIEFTAEQRFRLAFERLKNNEPEILEANSPVSQNNVAKEAGCDPSALRKSRFPSLVREIQAYVELHKDDVESKRQTTLKQRATRKKQRDQLADVVRQRDVAFSQIASANRRIVELSEEVKMLRLQIESLRPSPLQIRR